MKRRLFMAVSRCALLTLVLCSHAVTLGGCGGRRSEQYRQQGDVYFRLEKFSEAAREYERSIKANPENVWARRGLARCLWVQGEGEEALAAYREAIRLKPDFEVAYREGAKLMLEMGNVEGAEELAQQFEAVDPETGGILHALVLLDTEQADEAVAKLSALRSQFPQSIPVRVRLGLAYLAADQPEEAERELKLVLDEVDSDSLLARMALIDVYRARGEVEETVKQFEQLLAQRPDDVNLKLLLARSLLYSGRTEEAEAMARPIVEQVPDSGWANFIVGCCLLEHEAYGEALPYLEAAAQSLPQYPIAAQMLATARSGGGLREPEEVLRTQALAPAQEEKSVVPQRESWQQLWREARLRQLLQNRDEYLGEGDPGVRETLVLAALITQDMSLAHTLAVEMPEAAPMAELVRALSDRDVQSLRDLIDRWKEQGSQHQQLREYAVGFALSSTGMRGQALRGLSASLVTWPDNATPLYILGSMYSTARMPRFAARCFEKLVTRYPDNFEARMMLFGSLLAAGLKAEARQWAESTYGLYADQRQAILNLAQVYIGVDELDLAIDTLERGCQIVPGDEVVQLALAEAFLHAGKAESAQELVQEMDLPAELEAHGREIAAFTAASLGDRQGVLTALEPVDRQSLSWAGRLVYAAALIKAGRGSEVPDILENPQGVEPITARNIAVILAALGHATSSTAKDDLALVGALAGDTDALSNLAYGLACVEAKLYNSAFVAFKEVHDSLGGFPALVSCVLEALAAAQHITDRAARAESFAAPYDEIPAAWLGLAQVYRAEGDVTKQLEALDEAAVAGPDDIAVWVRRAHFGEDQQDGAIAAEAYQRILALQPDDPTANNNLAYHLLQNGGDVAQALAYARKAHEKLPSHPGVLHTLGLAQLESGALEDGQKNLTLALELQPGDPTMLLDFGRLLLARGMEEEGKHHVQLALLYADQLGLDFPRRAQAKAIVMP